MGNIAVIDIIFLFLILLMVIHGYVKGFVAEFFSWAVPVLSIWVAVLLYPAGAAFIRQRAMQDIRIIPEVLAFIVIFLIIMVVLKLLERILKDVIMGANLGGADKILGLIFGLVEGFTLTALVIFVLALQPLFDASKIIGDSIFARFLFPFIKTPLEQGKEIITTVLLTVQGMGFHV